MQHSPAENPKVVLAIADGNGGQREDRALWIHHRDSRVLALGVRLLWEPRGAWPAELIAELCAQHGLVHVVDPFGNQTVTQGVTYYRLHGISGSRHVYSDEELLRLRAMVPATGETYVMFNNIPRGNDARRFGELLGRGLVVSAEDSSDGRK